MLRNVDIEIRAGEFVALAGPSGHGKSTLLNLLLGVYGPTNGYIEYDGTVLDAWGLRELRQQIGAVMQNDTLLTGTIAENISLFSPTPDQGRIYEVAALAAVHDVIESMPMGYQTMIGELGNTLSGGQKQRLMIARALYRRPSLLILDEGTSQLDISTEANINDALKDLNITRIAAAHRPDTLAKADRVISVFEGRAFEGEFSAGSDIRVLALPD